MNKLFLIVFIGVLFLGGCNSGGDTGVRQIYKDYLVDTYVKVESMYVNRTGDAVLSVDFKGSQYSVTSEDETERAVFTDLAAVHGDKLGCEISVDMGYIIGNYVCYAEDFASLEISSDAAWDEEHPAGSSLGDLCRFMAYSYAPFIKNGNKGAQRSWIDKPVNELTPDDLAMLSAGSIKLYFARPLIDSQRQQRLIISFTTTDGRVLKTSLFLKPEA